MTDIVFRENATFRASTAVIGVRGICPTHGEVDGNFHCFVTSEPDYRSPNLCPKCYVDWISAHVQAVTPKESA
jgi:hypothetical protein